jgi:hypothetical protein
MSCCISMRVRASNEPSGSSSSNIGVMDHGASQSHSLPLAAR